MYAPKQYRPEKRKPNANFLALAEVEPQHNQKAGGEQEQSKPNQQEQEQPKKEQESNGNDLVSPDLRKVLALTENQPSPKEGGNQSNQPPQFKVKAGAPMQHKAATVQRKAGAAAGVEAKGKNPQDKQLPEEVLDLMNHAFGTDFSYVRIFANSAEAASLGALAFAQGTDIHFAPGQYNPESPAGKQLIGHELTHVVQQSQGRVQANAEQDGQAINNDPALEEEADRMGNLAAQGQSTGLTPAAPPTPLVTVQAKKSDKEDKFKPKQKSAGAKQFVQTNTAGSGNPEGSHVAPATVVDLTSGFNPPKDIADFLNDNAQKSFEINAKIGTMAKGKVKVQQKTKKAEGGAPADAEYQFQTGQYLDYLENQEFFSTFKLKPVIALDLKDPKDIKGVLAFKVGATVAPDPKKFIEGINQSLDDMGLQGFERLQVPDYTNEVINGQLHLEAPEIGTKIGGFLNATAKFGLMGNAIVFTAHADVDIKGMAQGALDIAKGEGGKYSGSAELGISIENVAGNIKVIYADGKITGRGEGSIESEKFKGTLTLIFDEKSVADQAVHDGMGVEVMEAGQEAAPAAKGDGPRVVAGFGSVEVQLTPWLTATAMVGIDSEGHVTIHGTMTFPGQVELMEQKDKKTDLFNLEIKAGYGVPLVGQIFLFASLGMFVKAGFGPLALHDIGMEGTYSTDPKVMNNFKITGALGISAYAQVGLSVKAGAGVTLLGHDVKAGIDLTASAGLKAYAEARPTFEYLEKAGPGGKVGEAHLKGHFEAAAQLFLELAGAFFVDLDAPWWSPVPDNHWEWPFGSMTLPIGDSMGVGADVDWLVGSPDVPELKFSPVQFDPDKFMSDMTKDPENVGQKGGKGGDKEEAGKWVDGAGGSDKTADPKLGPVKDDKKKAPKEDLTKLPDHERYLRALDEIGKLGDTSKGKPLGKGALTKKLKEIQSKYAIGKIEPTQPKDDSIKIHVTHKGENNSNNLIEVKLLSKAELDKQFAEAVADLEKALKTLGDPKTGAIPETSAKTAAHEVDLGHEVIDGTHVTVDGDHVTITGDIGTEHRKMASKPLAKGMDGDGKEQGVEADNSPIRVPFEMDGHDHTLIIRLENGKPEIFMASKEEALKKKKAEFEATYKNYYDRVPQAIQAALEKAYLEAKAGFEEILAMPIGDYFDQAGGSGSLKKVKKKDDGSFTSTNATIVKDHQREKAIGKINLALTHFRKVGKDNGIDDLSPLGLEKMTIKQHVEPLQQAVENVIKEFKEFLTAALPAGSKVKYRGSLATGIRSFKASTLNEAAQLIDPHNFDCDAFIEVSDSEWTKIVDLHRENKKIAADGKAKLENLTKWEPMHAILEIEAAIQLELAKVTGYKKKNGLGDFYFFVQGHSKTKGQENFGNRYPQGAIAGAGFPELENSLEKTQDSHKLSNDGGKTFTESPVVDSVKLPVNSQQVDLR